MLAPIDDIIDNYENFLINESSERIKRFRYPFGELFRMTRATDRFQ